MLILCFKIAFYCDNARLNQEVMGGLFAMGQSLPQGLELLNVFLDFAIHDGKKLVR